MVKVTTKKVKLSEIKLNPSNPRTITKKAMKNLVKSLQDFPEMMKLREIVVDENMVILGGNMRFLALEQLKAKDCTAKIVTGLTDEQKREFVIKDNGETWGKWDFDALANSWDDLPLADWGVELPKDWLTPKDGGGFDDTDPNDIKNQCKRGILVSIGFCDILVLPEMPGFDAIYEMYGKPKKYNDEIKEKLLEAIIKQI